MYVTNKKLFFLLLYYHEFKCLDDYDFFVFFISVNTPLCI